MTPYYEDDLVRIYHGDCRDVLPHLDPVETCITDPPYGLEFMGKDWDKLGAAVVKDPADVGGFQDGSGGNAFSRSRIRYGKSAASMQEWYRQHFSLVLDALLPGALCLAFGGTRTFHRLTCAIEDAGFEIRDCMMWLYGSGFPKSLDISKAIDNDAGAEREKVGERNDGATRIYSDRRLDSTLAVTAPATEAAQLWDGWGTALKPAWEPVVLAMKPLAGTFAQNALEHGVAGLNIDGCRIGHADEADLATSLSKNPGRSDRVTSGTYGADRPQQSVNPSGRWPANVILDEDAARLLDEQSGERPSPAPYTRSVKVDAGIAGVGRPEGYHGNGIGDSGGASRFFYTSKASRADRGPGNTHPTVKPSDLMKWLVKLTATPTGGTVLDPFMGSGTTLYAAKEMGRKAIGIELDEEYCEIAASRLAQGVLGL